MEHSEDITSGCNRDESKPCILYCNCTYAKVVPVEVKRDVLAALSSSGLAFDAVPDLCDMSARNDPALKRIAESGPLKIVACYDRAVKWLFHAANSPLPSEGVTILNMREEDAESIEAKLLESVPKVRSEI